MWKMCGRLAMQMTIQYGARASHVWITKTTDTYLEYVILICLSMATVVTRIRLSVMLYVN